MTVVQTIPATCEAIRFTGDNVEEVRKFVEFTGHFFRNGPNPFAGVDTRDIFYVTQAPGVILTVAKGEWLVYNLRDGKWRVASDKVFKRDFQEV